MTFQVYNPNDVLLQDPHIKQEQHDEEDHQHTQTTTATQQQQQQQTTEENNNNNDVTHHHHQQQGEFVELVDGKSLLTSAAAATTTVTTRTSTNTTAAMSEELSVCYDGNCNNNLDAVVALPRNLMIYESNCNKVGSITKVYKHENSYQTIFALKVCTKQAAAMLQNEYHVSTSILSDLPYTRTIYKQTTIADPNGLLLQLSANNNNNNDNINTTKTTTATPPNDSTKRHSNNSLLVALLPKPDNDEGLSLEEEEEEEDVDNVYMKSQPYAAVDKELIIHHQQELHDNNFDNNNMNNDNECDSNGDISNDDSGEDDKSYNNNDNNNNDDDDFDDIYMPCLWMEYIPEPTLQELASRNKLSKTLLPAYLPSRNLPDFYRAVIRMFIPLTKVLFDLHDLHVTHNQYTMSHIIVIRQKEFHILQNGNNEIDPILNDSMNELGIHTIMEDSARNSIHVQSQDFYVKLLDLGHAEMNTTDTAADLQALGNLFMNIINSCNYENNYQNSFNIYNNCGDDNDDNNNNNNKSLPIPKLLYELIVDLQHSPASLTTEDVLMELNHLLDEPEHLSKFVNKNGQNDNNEDQKIGTLQFPEGKLYGRADQVKLLQKAFYKVADEKSRHSELVLISGASGTGKSHLAHHGIPINVRKLATQRQLHPQSMPNSLFAHSSSNNSNSNISSSNTSARRLSNFGNKDWAQSWGPKAWSAVNPIDQDKLCGFFVSGKFDSLRGRQPYSALLTAFTELCHQIHSKQGNEDYDDIKYHIRIALGSQAHILTDLIPSLIPLLGEEPKQGSNATDKYVTTHPGIEARNRFNYVFRKFVRAIASPERPLILFLDDLQWADDASLDLMTTLLSDTANPNLLVLAAYRDNEVNKGHPFAIHLREMERRNVPITRIKLLNLSRDTCNHLISDTLQLSRRKTQSLSEVIYSKTHGNPFFVVQFLLYLWDEKLVSYSYIDKQWHWKDFLIKQVKNTNVVELLAIKISKLPSETQEILRTAAGIGSYFDDYSLKLICQAISKNRADSLLTGLVAALKIATQEGIIRKKGKMGYKFAHDRIQQAAYSLIPKEERPMLHLHIGRVLKDSKLSEGNQNQKTTASPSASKWRRKVVQTIKSATPSPQKSNNNNSKSGPTSRRRQWQLVNSEDMGDFLDRMLFLAVDQLTRGAECISTDDERAELAGLCLRAAERAIDSGAHVQAEEYLTTGLEMLEGQQWDNTNYELTLDLNNALAEAKYCNGFFDEAEDIVQEGLPKAQNLLDKLRLYSVRIKCLGAQSNIQGAIDFGFEVLSQLGEEFPPRKKVSKGMIAQDLIITKMMLLGKTDHNLSQLPTMKNELKLAAMQILCSMFSFTYLGRPEYMPLVAFRMMQLTLRYGICQESAFGLSTFALISCGILGDFKTGYRFAKLSLSFIERLNAKEWFAHVYAIVYFYCFHWREHVQMSIDPLLLGYRTGMVAGDTEYSMWCCYYACNNSFACGRPLPNIIEDLRGYVKLMIEYGQETPLLSLSVLLQAVLNLTGRAGDPILLTGEAMNEEQVITEATQMNNTNLLMTVNMFRLILSYMMGNYDRAGEMAEATRDIQSISPGSFAIIDHTFYDGLTSCVLGRRQSTPSTTTTTISDSAPKWRANAKKCMNKMRKYASITPDNCYHKYLLLKAEFLGTSDQKTLRDKALKTYEEAITSSCKSGFVQDEGLCYERAGQFCLAAADESNASRNIARAHELYQSWGAHAKVQQLDDKYSGLVDCERQTDRFQLFLTDLRSRSIRRRSSMFEKLFSPRGGDARPMLGFRKKKNNNKMMKR